MAHLPLPGSSGVMHGRAAERAQIQALLDAPSSTARVVLLIGPGGNGKTRLIEALAADLRQSGRLFLPAYDFYHIEQFKADQIEQAIVRALAQHPAAAAAFEPFLNASRTLEQAREGDEQYAVAQHAVREAFIACYNTLAVQYAETGRPLVLLFDTVEQAVDLGLTTHDSAPFAQDHASRGGEWWLSATLPRLVNTVAILSGRAETLYGRPVGFYAALEQAPEVELHRLALEGLPTEQISALAEDIRRTFQASDQAALRELAQGVQLDPLTLHTWQIVSNGQPFWIALLFSATMLGNGTAALADLRRRLAADPALTLTDAELADRRSTLLWAVFDDPEISHHPYAQALQWMAIARKGLTPGLLAAFAKATATPIDPQATWDVLARLLIVKQRRTERYTTSDADPTETLLFLHDELYAWFDREHIATRAFMGTLSQEAITWYDAALQQIEQEQLALSHQHVGRAAGDAARRHAARRKGRLTLDRLAYCFQTQREHGAAEYHVQAYAALQRHDIDEYISLRQEALRNYYRLTGALPPAAQLDDHAHAVLAALHTESPAEAHRRLNHAHAFLETLADPPPSAEALLCLAEAQVLLYTARGEPAAALALLERAETLLERAEQAEASFTAAYDDTARRAFLNAQIANWRGYYYRRIYALAEAITWYRHALRLAFTYDKRFPEMQAQTLTNLAFAHSEQGESDEARRIGRLGLALNQRYGSDYTIALSLNTLGRIEIRAGMPQAALSHLIASSGAFDRFKSINSARGLSLCRPVIAEANRREAELLDHDPHQQDLYFHAALRVGNEAHDHLIAAQIKSAERRREVYRVLGCTFRSWGLALRRRGAAATRVAELLAEAEFWLHKAVAEARNNQPPLLLMDVLEDLAVLYLSQGRYDAAVTDLLNEAEHLAPPPYRLVAGGGLHPLEHTVYGYWRELGQCRLQRVLHSLICFEHTQTSTHLTEAGEHLTLMLAYLLRYAHYSQALSSAEGLVLAQLRRHSNLTQLELIEDAADKAVQTFHLHGTDVPLRLHTIFRRARADLDLPLDLLLA